MTYLRFYCLAASMMLLLFLLFGFVASVQNWLFYRAEARRLNRRAEEIGRELEAGR